MTLRYPHSYKSQGSKIQFEGSKRPCCKKMPADDSVVTEMAVERLFYTAGDVWRSTILHKRCGCITSPCLKSRITDFLIMKRIIDRRRRISQALWHTVGSFPDLVHGNPKNESVQNKKKQNPNLWSF
ncbi:hypothetical protein TNCV_3297261 [Trichonephila clavipes]|uniref:Uncharacterized protein n=1 Tax=Trichonephila clavipes TaxID=2585209 RepID=A0A8X6SXS3_TRICX|nr:hypothetical protein TNCV_3297261 [Trichonephila clavipes]